MGINFNIPIYIVQWHGIFGHLCLNLFGVAWLCRRLCNKCRNVGTEDFIVTRVPIYGKKYHYVHCGKFGKAETIELLMGLNTQIMFLSNVF